MKYLILVNNNIVDFRRKQVLPDVTENTNRENGRSRSCDKIVQLKFSCSRILFYVVVKRYKKLQHNWKILSKTRSFFMTEVGNFLMNYFNCNYN